MSIPNSPLESRTSSISMSAKDRTYAAKVIVTPITASKPEGFNYEHHVNEPPTSFRNPWPSSPPPHSTMSILKARFWNTGERNYVPIPTDPSLLVPVRTPDWGAGDREASTKLKATWLGHASFLVEFPSRKPGQRGVRVLLDPVFSERMSPVSFLGPKRFTPTPCTLEELPDVDLVCISHNHYDHMDAATIRFIHTRVQGRVKFFCGLGVGSNLAGMGLRSEDIVEMDWWDGMAISVKDGGLLVGSLKVVCTPSQHISGRGVRDHGQTLWCSFVLEEMLEDDSSRRDVKTEADDARNHTNDATAVGSKQHGQVGKKLFFAGDTAYRSVPQNADEDMIAKLPVCAAFREIGELYGPFDLALLPIGCYSPRWWMSAVHCAPEDSICIHKDIRSKKSIGMHYGTIRGGISQYYEDVTEPPQRWRTACENAGLTWTSEIGLSDIGETVSM